MYIPLPLIGDHLRPDQVRLGSASGDFEFSLSHLFTFLGIVTSLWIGIDSLFDSILEPVAVALDVDNVAVV